MVEFGKTGGVSGNAGSMIIKAHDYKGGKNEPAISTFSRKKGNFAQY